jgi:predicted nuclease of predicted toxin-antitoxin system
VKSGSAPPPERVYFLDKCLGRKIVADALRAEGLRVEILEDHFERDTADTDWITEVGKRGWIILTKDSAVRHNALELIALLKANTHVFILTSANTTGEQNAQSFVAAKTAIGRMIEKFETPFIANVTLAGEVKVMKTREQLMDAIVLPKPKEG